MDRKFLRPGWIVGHLFVVLAVLVCLRLGRWQWDRMHEGGTIQNLGYAILWPVFGAAFVYMWFRFLQLEKLKDAEDDAELTALAAGGTATVPLDRAPVDRRPIDRAAPVGLVTGGPLAPPGAGHQAVPDGANLSDDREQAEKEAPQHSTGTVADPLPAPTSRVSRTTPSTGVTVAIATVGDDDEDDPELAAYNRALAALAEKDHRRAR